MRAKLKFQGEEIEIPDVEKVSGFRKFLGLMFNRKGNALLFEFNRPTNHKIHSLFCPDFLAIWLDENKIIDYNLITPNKFLIKPKKEFTKLLEIPISEKYSLVTKFFIVGEKDLNSPSSVD